MEQEIVVLNQPANLAITMHAQQRSFTQKIALMEQRQNFQQITPIAQHEEVSLNINNPNDKDLELFKSLPRFDRNIALQRLQAWTFIDSIMNFAHHPHYYSALGISLKFAGSSADILTNYNT